MIFRVLREYPWLPISNSLSERYYNLPSNVNAIFVQVCCLNCNKQAVISFDFVAIQTTTDAKMPLLIAFYQQRHIIKNFLFCYIVCVNDNFSHFSNC